MTAIATFLQSKLEARFGADAVRLVRKPGFWLKTTTANRTTAEPRAADDVAAAGKDLS
jgi:polar amino acid transport system permease protein